MNNYPNYNSNQSMMEPINFNTENNVGNLNSLNSLNLYNGLGGSGGLNNTGMMSSNNTIGTFNIPSNMPNPNENFTNLANQIDTISLNTNQLNGTNLNDLSGIVNKHEDNSSLIKSLTKEIISNLKENNIELYDNLSRKSSNQLDDSDSDNSYKKKKKKKDKDRTIKEDIQEQIEKSNPLPSTNGYIPWIFDECFNYKDFLILFTLYLILSQEMIKDFFAKYFSSLNPDDEGKINLQGVIIYGLILTILFMVIRKMV